MFKTIYATLIWRLSANGYAGNNAFIGDLSLQLDNAGISIKNILTRRGNGIVQITVEGETEMSDDVTEEQAEKWFWDAIKNSILPTHENCLFAAANEFAMEMEAV